MLINFIAIATFLGTFSFVIWIGRRWSRRASTPIDIEAIALQEIYGPAHPWLTAFAETLPLSTRIRDSLRGELVRAGYYRPAALDQFLGTRNAILMIWVVFAMWVLVVMPEHHRDMQTKFVWLSVTIALLIFAFPRLILSAQASARSRRIETALPDAIDMITMTMAGGVALRDAMRHVRSEIAHAHADLATELKIMEKQAEAGSLSIAMDRFAQRMDLPDVTGLAALIKQHDRLGGHVVNTLQSFADDVRTKRRQMAEENGNKASIKLLFPVVFCLAPPIYILLLGPAAIELRDFITRENEPGGVLSQNVTATAPLQPGPRSE